MTDTARYADVVLPATTQLEHLDTVFSWGHHYVTYNEPAIAARGEAKPNTEIFRLLAERMGLDDPCFRETDEEMLAGLFADAPAGVTLAELRERGWVKIDLGQAPPRTPRAASAPPTASSRCGPTGSPTRGVDALPFFDPPAEVADAELARATRSR